MLTEQERVLRGHTGACPVPAFLWKTTHVAFMSLHPAPKKFVCAMGRTKKEHNKVAYPASLKKRWGAQAAVLRVPGPALQRGEVHRQHTIWS